MMSIFLESLVLVLFRAALFLSCRSFVLNRLYPDLQNISTPSDEHDDVELNVLPTHAKSNSGRATNTGYPQSNTMHSKISRTVFAGCFSESCILFVLLMCQGLGLFDPTTRLLHWKFSLFILLLTILVLGPLLLSIFISTDSHKTSRRLPYIRLFISLIPVALSLFAISRIPLPQALRNDSKIDLITSSLARLLVVGTIILGLLSGFGAVSSSWTFLPSCISSSSTQGSGIPSERDIEQTERALERVKDDLTTRKRQLEAKRNATSSSNSGAPTSAGASWYSRIVPNLRGNDDEAEVAGLQLLYEQMDHNLSDLRRRKQDELFQRTIWGRMYGVVKFCMAIYWIARIIWTIVKVLIYRNFFASSLSPSTNYPDLISKLLADLLSFIHRRHFEGPNHDLLTGSDNGQTPADLGETQEKIKVIARQISLLFVGLVVLISIRMVLRGVSRILSRMTKLKLRRNLGASVMLVLLAQLMGIYLLSTIVQLRASFPPPAVSSSSVPELAFESDIAAEEPTNLFTTIPPFEVFGSLFDGAFLLAATLSILVRWMGNKIGAEWDP
ncbi:Abscisic acid G-protein coupled receptor-domain-containing protein [Lentinula lateritia]|uniref:Abscisic acid G-protein coupled receptor-domain-containing protein n=1 Tax=Lentinula lateritia TaxID=40482 RepID=A0ABQ8V5B7_9AGAR|nr:Abscisic acid G-protein coupled receptor-domain-containing protein [Lentinula lateritia]